VNPVPVAPTVDDDTDLTIAVDLSGPAELRPATPIGPSLIGENSYRKRILNFVESVRPSRGRKEPSRGMIDVAFNAMQAMQDTIADLKLSAYSPDVIVEVPRNACGFFEFWRAEELIVLGRERAAQAFGQAQLSRQPDIDGRAAGADQPD